MKCKHCESQWDVNPGLSRSITNCPFCGASLLPEPKKSETVEDVLVEIYSRFGAGILASDTKLLAYFSDLAPHLVKQRKILSYFLECDGQKKLLAVEHASEEEQLVCVRRIVNEMNQELFIEVAAAQMICDAFLFAITGRRLQETDEPEAEEPVVEEPVAEEPVQEEPIGVKPVTSPAYAEELFLMGEAYFDGTATVSQDRNKAFEYYQKAANLDHTMAQVKLGNGYETGAWGEENPKEAYTWYRRAANNNCALAQYHVGRCYATKYGIQKNNPAAFRWYQAAADGGNADAMAALGDCYRRGSGVTKDSALAFDWCEKAIQHGSILGITEISKLFANKKLMDQDLCLRFLQATQDATAAMKQEIQNSGYNIAYHLVRRVSTKAEGLSLMQQCAEAGDSNAQLWMGQAYHSGSNFQKDSKKALYWIQKSAEQKNPTAKELLRQIRGIDLSKNRVNTLVKKYQLGHRYLCSESPQFTTATGKAIKSFATGANIETPVLIDPPRFGKEGFLLTKNTLYYAGGLFVGNKNYPVIATKSISNIQGSIQLNIKAIKDINYSVSLRLCYTADANEAYRIMKFWCELLEISEK